MDATLANLLDFQVFSWNVNGLNQKFGEFLAFLEFLQFPKLVCLQETHSSHQMAMVWATKLGEYFCYFSHGTTASRGTAIFVHRSLSFNVIQEISDTQGRYVILKGFLSSAQITLGSIYAPSDTARSREIFFDEVIGLNLGNIHYLFGDYNSVLQASDRPNGGSGDKEIIKFCDDTVSKEAWRFIHPKTTEFSYARHAENGPFSRIDLCLVSKEAIDTITDARYISSAGLSDHKVLLVSIRGGVKLIGFDFKKIQPGTVSGEKFNNGFHELWDSVREGLGEKIIEKIDNGTFVGSLEEAFAEINDKCDFTNPVLLNNCDINGEWWDDVKLSVFKLGRKVQKQERIEKVGKYREKLQELLVSSGAKKRRLENEISVLLKEINQKELFKAKVEQRKNFEKSSGAFFRMIRESKHSAYLDHLNIENGGVLKDVDKIKNYFVNQYSKLYAQREVSIQKLKEFDKYIPRIDPSVTQIDGPITLEEVKKVVFRIAADKCPGHDGIPIEFYKNNFNIIGPYLVKLFNNICSFEGEFPESWDLSILKLIPKSEFLCFDNFRPLQMINFDCKILAGVWADRIGEIVSDIINQYQTGGVKGRCIQQSTLLIHLLIQYQKQQGKGGFVVSKDDKKAFDNLIRDYLFYVLKKYGFSDKTISVIKKFYKNNKCKIIVNGFLSEAFSIKNGIRQGCPLSALLYVLAVEPLSVAILLAQEMAGFRLPNNSEVKLIQHVDDLNVFAQNKEGIRHVLSLFKDFGEISGSIINRDKSFIIQIGHSNESYTIEGIPVLKNKCETQLVHGKETSVFVGEFRKILGIYFCANVKQYVHKNWMEIFRKCGRVMDMWEKVHLSLIGKVLVLNIKVIPKIFYLLQSIEPVKYWQDRLMVEFQKFVGGGSSSIPLTILEWGRDKGGLGLISILNKARSLRFSYVKDFLKRLPAAELSPVNSILGYYLDIAITSRYRPGMARTGQLCYGGDKKVINRGNMRKTYFQHFLEDLGLFTIIENKYDGVDRWSQKEYYCKISEYAADLFIQENNNLVTIKKLHLNEENEKILWGNVFLKSLCTKVQAFNLRLVHGALPTMEVIGGKSLRFPNKYCSFCRNVLNINKVENETHILLECHIAKAVWHIINDKLKAAFLEPIVVNKYNIFYKIGMGKPQVHFISEINWALWRNRCSNVYDGQVNGHRAVLRLACYRLDLISRLDRVILGIKIYNQRWLGINQAIDAVT